MNMNNKKLAIWIIVIVLGVCILGILWYMAPARSTTPKTTESAVTLPVSGSAANPSSSTSIATSSQGIPLMTLTVQDGSTIVTHDFIHNGVTIPDTANTGQYLLAGNLGYCFSDPQQCQAAPSSDFNVYYNSTRQSFIIALTKEPIGQARLDMEQFMLATLGITQQQMCSLNYFVGVTKYINAQFSGKNLGFSFCPGATVLPQ